MAQERLSMRKIKEILRLRWELGFSRRQTAGSCRVSHSTISEYENRARQAGLSWAFPEDLDEGSLESLVFPQNDGSKGKNPRPTPDMIRLHQELRKPGVSLQFLWVEYKEQYPDGYQYSQVCDVYRRWAGKLHFGLRQEHQAGEKVSVDFSGQRIANTNPLKISVACGREESVRVVGEGLWL